MRRIPLRWASPTFHLALDAILVAILVDGLLHMASATAPFRTGPFLPASYDQNFTVFDPRSPGLVKPFSLLITGTLPAGIISLFALSFTGHDVNIPYDSRAFLWLAFYEFLAVPLWVFIGRKPSAFWWCIASIFVRTVACLIGFSGFWRAGPGLQAIFWLIATIYVIATGLWGLQSVLSVPEAPPKKLSSGEQL
jgi:hypothetical protein